ncbi:MAG: hypothetical protein R2745_00385 [Vicinamibacterales bacterium]
MAFPDRRVVALAALSACLAVAAPAAEPVAHLPRRLVLGLDGVGYADMRRAQEAGRFQAFHPVSRLVSTFPSISDIAWSEIFGTAPPPGYQRIYFDLAAGQSVGGGLDPVRPIEFERRMHLGFEAMAHHMSSYVVPGRAARGELARLYRSVFESRDVDTFYAYLPAPDALQHVRGDLAAYLADLDVTLIRILRRYRAATGLDLELVVLSDHAHNGIWPAKTLDLSGFLRTRGFTVTRRLARPGDVVFSTDGVSTGVGVFVAPAEAARAAEVLATLPGVALATWRPDDQPDVVGVRNGAGEVAWIVRRDDGRLAYRPDTGDPLRYVSLATRLLEAGEADADGFATPQAWLRVSVEHDYPAALARIVRGHRDVTRNPAPVLLSIADGYQVANGTVAFFNRVRPLGGTHGSLNARNSVGIVMATFRPTDDATTADVGRQFDGFAELPPPRPRAARRPRP